MTCTPCWTGGSRRKVCPQRGSGRGGAVFPIAHCWLLETLIPAPLPAHRLGAVWPDMLLEGPISHADSHQRGRELLTFARTRVAAGEPGAREFAAFVVGALTHGSAPQGFDWYSDESYDEPRPDGRGY